MTGVQTCALPIYARTTKSSFVEAVFLALVKQVCLGATCKTNNENESEKTRVTMREAPRQSEAKAEQAQRHREVDS